MSGKKGILLVNVGTPDDATPEKVGAYLKEFLMDPLVLDIPWALRWFLVNVLIVPKRSHQSAHAYQKIWTQRGSPLKFFTEDLASRLQIEIGDSYVVDYAMRYQNPSIESVLSRWKSLQLAEILVFPLYPQYSLSATKTAIDECQRIAKKLQLPAPIRFLKPFYREPEFIEVYSELLREVLDNNPWDHVLFSFHGLPARHIQKVDVTRNHCFKSSSCCDSIQETNQDFCYRAQCFETARQIARESGVGPSKYTVSFQSRLGREWIEPFTDVVLPQLQERGVRDLVVACPSFTTDCLETLEEIGVRARESFKELGGQALHLVSCPNSRISWARALKAFAAQPLTHFKM